jgi:hypothetical protein
VILADLDHIVACRHASVECHSDVFDNQRLRRNRSFKEAKVLGIVAFENPGSNAARPSAPITDRSSSVRLLSWNGSRPPGASFRRYYAGASRVSRCIGMLSELNASMISAS